MVDFSKLKKSASLDKLTKALQESNKSSNNSADDRFWQPVVDKAGNGYAIIRFLDAPAADGDDAMPWVQLFSHGFQGPGGWYIENSLTTLGQTDPVSEYNTSLWNTGLEANKELARKQKRKLNYVSNILVIKHAGRPEDEGKIFLYKYGKKIFDKIKEKLEPPKEFEDETAVNPFSFWEGANFKLKIRNLDGYRNYDKSEFEGVSAAASSDAEIEKLWRGSYSLNELVEAKNFKSYDELKRKLNKVLGSDTVAAGGVPSSSAPARRTVEDSNVDDDPPFEPNVKVVTSTPNVKANHKEEEDDTLDYFAKLAQDS